MSVKVTSVPRFFVILLVSVSFLHSCVAFIRRQLLATATETIDLDEADAFVETENLKWGKCAIRMHCREAGPYGHSKKTTFAMAIASGPCRSRWRKLSLRPGTDLQFFIDFIQEILNDIGPGTAQHRRCFLMDNLSTHRHQIIAQMIIAAGHRSVYRVPYYPVDGPIEYVFNTIQQELGHRMHLIHYLPSLHAHINAIVASPMLPSLRLLVASNFSTA
jgi:hypothetical protein